MRVTHKMIAASVAINLNKNLYSLERMSTQLSNGKLFDRPSQDPVGTVKVMRLHVGMARNNQYQKNITEARIWLDATESALKESIAVVQRLRELAIDAVSGTKTAEDLKMILPEAQELLEHLQGLANSEYSGLYLFAGHKTKTKPFSAEADGTFTYHGDSGVRRLEISRHDSLTLNIAGGEIFGGTGSGDGLLEAAAEVVHALAENDTEALGGEILKKLDAGLQRLLAAAAETGGRQERLNAAFDRLFAEEIHMREARSQTEDLDYAKAIMEYAMQENAYRAALATGARMVQPSLVNYLR
ncbi:MAG: flagellar hook-associated protein FlgL [Dethiobacteria bacterium]|jgi:flagellar hook-associated protein 3 FlgL